MRIARLIGIIGCAGVLALTLSGCGESPEGEAKRAIRAVASGSASAVVSLMPPEDRKAYRESSSEQKKRFREQVKRLSEELRKDKKGIRKVKILERNIQGDSARIKVEITYGNGDVETTTMRMRKFGGDWCTEGPGFF